MRSKKTLQNRLPISVKTKPTIRVLHVGLSDGIGGIETFLLNLYTTIDRNKILFDFVTTCIENPMRQKMESLGATVYRIAQVSNILRHSKDFWNILQSGNYMIVHFHKNSTANISLLIVAKLAKVPEIILHSHNTRPSKGRFTKYIHYVNRLIARRLATTFFSCSKPAAEWMFGTRYLENKKSVIIKNGVLAEKFQFNSVIRETTRTSLGFSNQLIVGVVGRFVNQKNHNFIVDTFSELHRLNSNSILVFCGTGELEDTIRLKVQKLKIDNDVRFLGQRIDIPNLLQAFDIMLICSFYEGLPFVGIEAQASGLPCLCSSFVTSDIRITEYVEYLPLNAGPLIWAEKIIDMVSSLCRRNTFDDICKAGFNMQMTSQYLQEFYDSRS